MLYLTNATEGVILTPAQHDSTQHAVLGLIEEGPRPRHTTTLKTYTSTSCTRPFAFLPFLDRSQIFAENEEGRTEQQTVSGRGCCIV